MKLFLVRIWILVLFLSTHQINRNYSNCHLYDVNTNAGNRIVNNADSLELKILTSHTTT
jgi:hypothetical protein